MQNIEKLSKKNGVLLENYGNCQFCGSDTNDGVYECFEMFNNISYWIEAGSIQQFLCADAHALQHQETHGKWNNNLHLTRLYLIMKRGIRWNYAKTPFLSKTLDLYKINNVQNIIISPPPLSRGKITVSDLINIEKTEAFNDLVQKWAIGVYDSYSSYHSIAKEIGEIYFEKYEK